MLKGITTNPLVSIGVPVFNQELTLNKTLNSLVSQNYSNIEIVISDNCSTDSTLQICKEFKHRFGNIIIYEQTENIGPTKNFEFVLRKSSGELFMWCAGDDELSTDFISANVYELQQNPSAIGSTSPNNFAEVNTMVYTHEMSGSTFEKYQHFFSIKKECHGIFYSLFRKEKLTNCPFISKSFVGWDWAILLYMSQHGNLVRISRGLATFGINGISRSGKKSMYETLNIRGLWRLFPFLGFSFVVCTNLLRPFSMKFIIMLFGNLFKLNFNELKSLIRRTILNFLIFMKNKQNSK